MSRLKLLAVAATLALAPVTAAVAQEAAPAQAEAPQGPPVLNSPADEAFRAQGTALEAELQGMNTELQAIMADTSLDNATKIARTDAVLNTYQPKIDAFSVVLKNYLVDLANRPEGAEQRDQILASAEVVPAQLQNVTNEIRAGIRAALEAPATPQ